MPPSKHIVKSGKAGNSKSSGVSVDKAGNPPVEEKKLFPTGFKYPLSLLNERCQKNGWERAIVDTFQAEGGFSFAVSLRKLNKKTSRTDTVRLQPHPPYIRPSTVEARQWGATYAMHRFANNIQLNRVLPPGPAEYWNELEKERKSAPEHQQWMYDQDPFAARKAVEERQAQAAAKAKKASDTQKSEAPKIAKEYLNAPEVKMGESLRAMVEDVIKRSIDEMKESSHSAMDTALPTEDLQKQLETFGFRKADIQTTLTTLQSGTSFAQSLLEANSPLEACLELLLLRIPECHLPRQFLSSKNASAPLVTALHSASADIKKRWILERAVKEGGWPSSYVSQCMADNKIEDFPSLIQALNNRGGVSMSPVTLSSESVQAARETELSALQALYDGTTIESDGDNQIVSIPMTFASMSLKVAFSKSHSYPLGSEIPPLYLTSTSVPRYIRLHILNEVVKQLSDIRQEDEPILFEAANTLQTIWDEVEQTPPGMSEVMSLYATTSSSVVDRAETRTGRPDDLDVPSGRAQLTKRPGLRVDPRSDASILKDFQAMRQKRGYLDLLTARSSLPVAKYREQFLDCLSHNQVVVIVGDTGCGKTTQRQPSIFFVGLGTGVLMLPLVPQYILDSLIEGASGSRASILVTQPRRVAAVSVATRVSAERADDGSVGYAIRGESKSNEKTKIVFCTTGVALRRLAGKDGLTGVTHLVVDEVHERSVDSDFLLLEIRELLKTNRKLKLVIMSATIDPTKFSRYFGNAPVLEVPGRTFPVKDFYLDDVVSSLQYRQRVKNLPLAKWTDQERHAFVSEYSSEKMDEEGLKSLEYIIRSGAVDYHLVAGLVKHVMASHKRCGVLIFVSGVSEIRQCLNALKSINLGQPSDLFGLHAGMTSDEQRSVFKKTDRFKIIVATNVAETSITVEDVAVVIDTGKMKETDFNSTSGLVSLSEKWVTQAAARQRRGRSGRSRAGYCYKLYTYQQEGKFKAFSVPEILRMPLENVVLTAKSIRAHGKVETILAKALDPPSSDTVAKAANLLKELGALDENEILTALGRQLSQLPLDVRLGKMIVLGTIFRCLNPILTVAALLSSKPLLYSTPENRDEVSRVRSSFATMNSDLLTDCKIYQEAIVHREDSKSIFEAFCSENFIANNSVREITNYRQELFSSLFDIGFLPLPRTLQPSDPRLNVNAQNESLLKSILLGGLWPRAARVYLPKSAVKFDQVQAGTVRRQNEAREFRLFDIADNSTRVFAHPGSVMFSSISERTQFVAYFNKHQTTKIFLRDVTEVPTYAILLFGGPIYVNHVGGGIAVGGKENQVHLKAWSRIGVLVNQLRSLLDQRLRIAFDEANLISDGKGALVVQAMLSLLETDGVSY